MKTRKLISGRRVPEKSEQMELAICSKCPAKWLFVDLETGDVWHVRKDAKPGGYPFWRFANEGEVRELRQVANRLLRPEHKRLLSGRK